MYEYYVEACNVREAEGLMNQLAAEGWRVITVTPDIAGGHGVVITFERQKG